MHDTVTPANRMRLSPGADPDIFVGGDLFFNFYQVSKGGSDYYKRTRAGKWQFYKVKKAKIVKSQVGPPTGPPPLDPPMESISQ